MVTAHDHVLHVPRTLQLLQIVATLSQHRQGAEAMMTFFKAVPKALWVGRVIQGDWPLYGGLSTSPMSFCRQAL